jgi:hypothetical protein
MQLEERMGKNGQQHHYNPAFVRSKALTPAPTNKYVCQRVPQNKVLLRFSIYTVNEIPASVPDLGNKACPCCVKNKNKNKNNCLCLIMPEE